MPFTGTGSPGGVFVAVEVQHCRLVVNHRFKMHRSSPKRVHVFERLARVTHVQLSAFVAVLQI